ncbi:MAG: energy-coupling factor ABC transporter ATP-binding protein [Ardenticatenaceae bacterium]|nr:energy-coupling factor ABC transporter ATP-binding protein [Ardenticatenaceae bacterium]
MIQVKALSVSYGRDVVLQGVDLHVRQGEWVLVTGPSGCGKSTLGRALTGLIPHAIAARMAGSVQVAGIETRERPLPELAQHVGMIFQNPASQLFHLHVADEVAFGLRNLGFDEQDVQSRTEWALQVTGLEPLRDHNPAQLSGGQKQCVAIACVLAMRPPVLVLDEPTASLDMPNTRRVLDTLKTLQTSLGMTILMIEHRLAAVMPYVDTVLLMDKGKIVRNGRSQDILADAHLRQTLGLRRPTESPLIAWNALVKAENGTQKTEPEKEAPLVLLENVSAGYQRKTIIQDVNLSIYPGEFVALVGDNGAGKSTLAQVVAGLKKPAAGRVTFRNRRPQPGLDVSMLFQNPADQVFTDSVDEEVRFGPENYGRFQSDYHQELLTETDLLHLRQRRPTAISVGQQQRTVLAACIALKPQLVILDEPTLGQDWGHLQRLMNYLQRLNERGTVILLISHDYKLVFRYARRAIFMENGRIKTDGVFAQKWEREQQNEIINA